MRSRAVLLYDIDGFRMWADKLDNDLKHRVHFTDDSKDGFTPSEMSNNLIIKPLEAPKSRKSVDEIVGKILSRSRKKGGGLGAKSVGGNTTESHSERRSHDGFFKEAMYWRDKQLAEGYLEGLERERQEFRGKQEKIHNEQRKRERQSLEKSIA